MLRLVVTQHACPRAAEPELASQTTAVAPGMTWRLRQGWKADGGRSISFPIFRRAKPIRKGVVPEHLRERFAYLDQLSPAASTLPWRRLGAIAVGGLQHVGFASGRDLLLVLSSSGRGVIDCATGQRLARDDGEYYPDIGSLEAEGIGPLAGETVHVTGIDGGGLTRGTKDGWGIELHPLSWPEEELFLCPPGQTMLWQPAGDQPGLLKLQPFPTTLVAYGFSPTGRSLVIATSSDVEIFHRD
jgi:hypothetical protein